MSLHYKQIDRYYYNSQNPIGEGSYGRVYKAVDQITNRLVAVKVVPSKKLLDNKLERSLLLREINILRQLEGEHIVQLIDIKRTANNLYIFMDYCDGGDLSKRLKDNRCCFTEEEACSIIKQIAMGFLFSQNRSDKNKQLMIMHRDIKPANILFHEGRVKIADFGFAKFVNKSDEVVKGKHLTLGTLSYMSPQVLGSECYSTKCDVWSTGILFYKILFGKIPWSGSSIPELLSNIESTPLKFPKKISFATLELLINMLQIQEEKRFSWQDVYDHPALNISISSF